MKTHESSNQATVDSTDSTKIDSSDANNNQYENVHSERPDSQTTCENLNNGYFDKFDSEQDRKLFIGYGLNLIVNEHLLEDFFSKFGTVERVIIKRDVITAKQRGFAFITMAKPEDVQKIIDANPITIKGKPVDVKLAKSRPISKKVFVGGIDPNLTKEEITSYFNTYGDVIDIELPYDRMKKKRREFCFIIFDSEDSANLASEKSKQTIFGRECDVKKACPQPIAQQQKRQNLQQSYNSTHTQAGFPSSHYGGLSSNHNKNSKTMYSSPSSMKNGGSYRGNYRGKNPINRSNNGYYQSGRRSVDSQYGTIYEHNNASSYNSNFSGRKGAYHQSNSNRQNQYLQNGNAGSQMKVYNGHHAKQTHQQVQPINQAQQQAFYDPISQQQQPNYYGYQIPFANDYYTAQQHYAQQPGQHANSNATALNTHTYNAQSNALQHTNTFAGYNQQNTIDPAQYLAYQQYQYTLNQAQLNSNLTAQVNTNLTTLTQQQQTNVNDYQTLDERYFQEQQKQFENNLMNNYEKFDGLQSADDVTAYQAQLINNSNLLNVQYQGSIQQC